VTNKPSNRFNSAAKGQVQAPGVSGLIHARHRPQPVGQVPPLRDDAFEPELAGVREDDRAVAVEMLGIECRRCARAAYSGYEPL